jgi:hypothetical protein
MVYTSEFTGESTKIHQVLDDIRAVAKARNQLRNVTGVLFFENGRFLQLLEGEVSMLRQLMVELHKDPRHTDIMVLIDEPTDTPKFPDWQMDTFEISEPSIFNRQQLLRFRDMYKRNVKMDSAVFMDLLQGVLSDPAVVARMNQ